MRKIKFRAIIPERNATIYFDLGEIARLGDLGDIERLGQKFSTREILIPWLLKGNIPDLYIRIKDRNGEEAYQKDKVSAWGYSNWIIEWHNNGWKLKQEGIENYQEIPDDFIIIGCIYENLELLEKQGINRAKIKQKINKLIKNSEEVRNHVGTINLRGYDFHSGRIEALNDILIEINENGSLLNE